MTSTAAKKSSTRASSSESSTSTESSLSSLPVTNTSAASGIGVNNNSVNTNRGTSALRYSTARDGPLRSRPQTTVTTTTNTEKKPFVSRFLPQHSNTSSTTFKSKPETDSSSEEEEESSAEESNEEDVSGAPTPKVSTDNNINSNNTSRNTTANISGNSSTLTGSNSNSIGSGNYVDRLENRRNSRNDTQLTRPSTTMHGGGYGSNATSSGLTSIRQRPVPAPHHEPNPQLERLSYDHYRTSASNSRYGNNF